MPTQEGFDPDAPDDGSAAWAEGQAAAMPGVAMVRKVREAGAEAAAEFFVAVSKTALWFYDGPQFREARLAPMTARLAKGHNNTEGEQR